MRRPAGNEVDDGMNTDGGSRKGTGSHESIDREFKAPAWRLAG